MNQLMALPAYGNQVLLGVVAGVAAELFVMEFESGHCAAKLTSPGIPPKYFVAELFVQFGIKPQARLLRSDPSHDTFSVT